MLPQDGWGAQGDKLGGASLDEGLDASELGHKSLCEL